MKNIVVIPNVNKDASLEITRKVADELCSLGAEVYVESKYQSFFSGNVSYYDLFPESAELIVVIGGDGSMLDASHFAIELDIPMIGINLGKVGYLNEVEPQDIATLANIFSHHYNIKEKMTLSVIYGDGESVKKSPRLAVNDVVFSHENYLGIADFTLKSKSGAIRYRADGLAISTPQGSTAYSLSAGGPVVSHDVNAFLVTPICPHSFFNRSIVFPSDESIEVENTGDDNLNVSVDGRHFVTLKKGERCNVSVSDSALKILSFKDNNMFSSLFKKMKILEDI